MVAYCYGNKEFEIKEYRYVKTDDPNSLVYNWHSRCYEYPTAINAVKAKGSYGLIHNVGCGSGEDQIYFRKILEEKYGPGKVIHSDIIDMNGEYPTTYYNLIYGNKDFSNKFDIIFCISILEHIEPEDRKKCIDNLVDMLKVGGLLAITFDIVKENTDWIDDIVGIKINNSGHLFNGINGVRVNPKYQYYKLGLLVMERFEPWNRLHLA